MARRLQLEAEAEAARLKAENETRTLVERQKAAEALEQASWPVAAGRTSALSIVV